MMKVLFITTLVILINISFTFAMYFEDSCIGVRPYGMGCAFTSIGDDINTLYYNPGGIGFIEENEFTLQLGLGPGIAANIGSINSDKNIGFYLLNDSTESHWNYQILSFTYGKTIFDNLSVGVSPKLFLSWWVGPWFMDGRPPPPGSKEALFDVGMMSKIIRDKLNIGVVIQNMKIFVVSEKKMDTLFKLGSSLYYKNNTGILSLDVCFLPNGFNYISLGNEIKANDKLDLRVGFNTVRYLCLGFGYKFNSFSVDYTLDLDFDHILYFSRHKVGIIYKFGNTIK